MRQGIPVLVCESGHEFFVYFQQDKSTAFTTIVKDKDMEKIEKISIEEIATAYTRSPNLDTMYLAMQKEDTETDRPPDRGQP